MSADDLTKLVVLLFSIKRIPRKIMFPVFVVFKADLVEQLTRVLRNLQMMSVMLTLQLAVFIFRHFLFILSIEQKITEFKLLGA